MSIYSAFQTDPDLEEKGVIIDYGECQFLIARAGGANRAYTKMLQTKMRPHARAAQAGMLDPKLSERLVREAFCRTVLLDWKGVTVPKLDDDGNEVEADLPFSVENAEKLMTDLPELFVTLMQEAQGIKLFLAESREEVSGN